MTTNGWLVSFKVVLGKFVSSNEAALKIAVRLLNFHPRRNGFGVQTFWWVGHNHSVP